MGLDAESQVVPIELALVTFQPEAAEQEGDVSADLPEEMTDMCPTEWAMPSGFPAGVEAVLEDDVDADASQRVGKEAELLFYQHEARNMQDEPVWEGLPEEPVDMCTAVWDSPNFQHVPPAFT